MIRGTLPGMKKGTVLGHEAVGIVEAVGQDVKAFTPGDRVVVCSTIACGTCVYCNAQEFSSCDNSNPNGPEAGTSFFGGPQQTGPFDGLQAERQRIPFADTVLVKVPDAVSDTDALLCSDIFPTGYMGAEIADVKDGDYVAVFGCGPVGQMAIASAKLLGAKEVFAVDSIPDRLEHAARQGAVPINFDQVDPVKELKDRTNGFGPDACIDAVGVDAQRAHDGPAAKRSIAGELENAIDRKLVAPKNVLFGKQWRQGEAPAQVIHWCMESVRKSGVVSIIGVYPATAKFFPVGMMVEKALTVRGANCSHRKYIPKLLQIVEQQKFAPSQILTKIGPMMDVIEAYKHFDKREPGWLKVELIPGSSKKIA